MPLVYLNLANRQMESIDILLKIIDGQTFYIPSICLNANFFTNQTALSDSIRKYPKPSRLGLDLRSNKDTGK